MRSIPSSSAICGSRGTSRVFSQRETLGPLPRAVAPDRRLAHVGRPRPGRQMDRAVTPVELLRRLHDCFDAHRLRARQAQAADAVLTAVQEVGALEADAAASALPVGFLAPNGISRRDATALLDEVFSGLRLAVTLPL